MIKKYLKFNFNHAHMPTLETKVSKAHMKYAGQIRADVYKEQRKCFKSQGSSLWQSFWLLCSQHQAHLQFIHLTDECTWHYVPKALIKESLVI